MLTAPIVCDFVVATQWWIGGVVLVCSLIREIDAYCKTSATPETLIELID